MPVWGLERRRCGPAGGGRCETAPRTSSSFRRTVTRPSAPCSPSTIGGWLGSLCSWSTIYQRLKMSYKMRSLRFIAAGPGYATRKPLSSTCGCLFSTAHAASSAAREQLTFYDAATVRLQDNFGFNNEPLRFPGPHRMIFGPSMGETYCTTSATYTYRISKGSLRFAPVGTDQCSRRRHFLKHFTWQAAS